MVKEKIINAEGAILGRISSLAAKQALLGKEVVVVNCNKAIITGRKEAAIKNYLEKKRKGGSSQRGPNIHSAPEKILKRTIRGMLPYKKGKGADALKRVRCYNEVPEKYKEKVKKNEKLESGLSLKELSLRLKENG